MPEVSIHADLSQIGRFVRGLERAEATAVRARIRRIVNDVGGEMLSQARANASWSSKIPRATTLKTSFSARGAGVKMRTDPRRAPMAYYFERGSKGSGGRYIRHPVYGSQSGSARADVRDRYDNKRTWRQMPTRPYFFRAGAEGKRQFVEKMQEELNTLAREVGFRG